MDFQGMKKLLLNYPHVTEKIHSIGTEIEMSKTNAKAIRESVGINLDGMPHGNKVSDSTYQKTEQIIDTCDKRIQELLDELGSLLNKQRQVADILRTLDHEEFKIIEARYLNGIRWDFVPGQTNISRAHCFRLHDRAIIKMLALIESRD